MFGSRPRHGTGIHMVDGSLLIVELVRERDQTQLHHAVRLPLSGIRHLGQLADEECCLEFAEALECARDELNVSFDSAYIAFDGPATFLKRRARVSTNDRRAREHLRWEAEQFLPDAAEEFAIDFLLSGRHGFIVAVRRASIELIGSAFGRAGLESPGLDIVPFALCNALEASGLGTTHGYEALVDVGSSGAEFALLHNGRLRDVWTCPWGPVPGIAEEEDEETGASSVGLFEDGEPNDAESGAGLPSPTAETVACLQQGLEQAAAEVGPEHELQRLWLTGPAAGEGWLETLSAHVGPPVLLLDPLGALAPPAEPDAEAAEELQGSDLAAAAGLAFRALAE